MQRSRRPYVRSSRQSKARIHAALLVARNIASRCMQTAGMSPGVLLWQSMCVKTRCADVPAYARVRAEQCACKHANTQRALRAIHQFSGCCPPEMGSRRCFERARGRQSAHRLSQCLPSRCRPLRSALQSLLSSRPLAVITCENGCLGGGGLRVEFLLKTESGYISDAEVT